MTYIQAASIQERMQKEADKEIQTTKATAWVL